MKKKWKIALGSAVALAVVIFLAVQALQGVEVEVIEVVPGEVKQSFTEDGVVKARQEHRVYSLHSTRVQALLVEEGDLVAEGDLLAVLEDEEIKYALEELEAQLQGLAGEEQQLRQEPGPAEIESIELGIEQANRFLATAERNYQRVESLYEEGAASTVELEEAEDMLQEAEHNLEQQEKALEQLHEAYEPARGSAEIISARRSAILSQMELLQYQQENYRIHAPIPGIVANLEAEEKGLVTPQVPLMELFHPEDYLVEARILTQDVLDITAGMPVELTFASRNDDIVFPGEVIRLARHAERDLSPLGLEEERVKVTILPDPPADFDLAPGYRLEVEFVTEELPGELAVPKSSIFTYEGEDALFVVENGRARVRTVARGLETRYEVVISEGLSEGELVILNPRAEGIDDGARVTY